VCGPLTKQSAPREPVTDHDEHYPLTRNDEQATRRTAAALRTATGLRQVIDPGPVSGSEDVGVLATSAGTPLVYRFLGGADPSLAQAWAATGRPPEDIPSNHSPRFAPRIQPTLSVGIGALAAAAHEWLDQPPNP
jgi:metal-dependent amidase/aminoacylase/carboxypeptidase family protein